MPRILTDLGLFIVGIMFYFDSFPENAEAELEHTVNEHSGTLFCIMFAFLYCVYGKILLQ